MKTPLGIMAALLGSSLWALAQQTTTKEPALPPLPPGLPADTAKVAPARQLTEQEKTAAKEANEAAKSEAARRIEQAEKFLQSPLRTTDGKPATREQMDAAEKERAAILTEEFRRQHEENRRELDDWMRLYGGTLPPFFKEQRPAGIANGFPQFPVTYNLRAAHLLKVTNVWPDGDLGVTLTGAGVGIGVWDVGLPQTNHSEFNLGLPRLFRLETQTGVPESIHATQMAGTIGAAGIVADAKGMATNAVMAAFDSEGDIGEMSANALTSALRISNHSYGKEYLGWELYGNEAYWLGLFSYPAVGANPFEDFKFGAYREYTRSQDSLAFSNPRYLIVRAAGNDRRDNYPGSGITLNVRSNGVTFTVMNGAPAYIFDGDQGGFDTIAPDATGKNVLTVGAVTATNILVPVYLSAYGPTDDGRVKPDVVAVGEFLSSPSLNGGYAGAVGTSGAAAATTGISALLLEHWRNFFGPGNDPWSSTLKALLIHTAADLYTFGPAFKTGWGRVDARKAADLLSANTNLYSLPHLKQFLLDQGGTVEFPITVSATNELRVTIVWTDPEAFHYDAMDRTNSVLVNDLDLRVFGPDGSTNYPFAPNADLTNQTEYVRNQTAGTGDNWRDNVEQVRLLSPTSGVYRVVVGHKGILQQPGVVTNYAQQSFTLAASGNTPEPAPELSLQTLINTNGNVLLHWPSVPGRRYRAQYNDDLGTTNWSAYGDVVAARTNVTLAVTSTNEARFFRLRIME